MKKAISSVFAVITVLSMLICFAPAATVSAAESYTLTSEVYSTDTHVYVVFDITVTSTTDGLIGLVFASGDLNLNKLIFDQENSKVLSAPSASWTVDDCAYDPAYGEFNFNFADDSQTAITPLNGTARVMYAFTKASGFTGTTAFTISYSELVLAQGGMTEYVEFTSTPTTTIAAATPSLDVISVTKRTKDPQGLRFKSSMAKDSFFTSYNATRGTLIAFTSNMPTSEFFNHSASCSFVDIPAVNTYMEDANSLQFTAVLTDIPESANSTLFTACAYAKFTVGSTVNTYYSNSQAQSIAGISGAAA